MHSWHGLVAGPPPGGRTSGTRLARDWSQMIGALSRWRKPDKQTAYDAALQRGAKLGIKKWVVPREQMDLGVK